jgi:hypothetical protein
MKTTTAIIVVVVAAIALVAVLPARPAAAAPKAEKVITITRVSALNLATNTWATTLSSGDTLQVELRALNGAGAPRIGAISNLVDQGWLPILGYYGYATFTQNGTTYYAHR